MLYQIYFYKHTSYHTLWFCSEQTTAQYELNMMPVALLTGKSEDKIFKSRIYFQHPHDSTKCISYEFHNL